MRIDKFAVILAVPALLLAGCETSQTEDTATLQMVSTKADDADRKATEAMSKADAAAARADDAAQNAQQAAAAAREAADAANRAAAEAKAAADRADRMFQRSLRK